jgi:hypothetical protein
MTFLYSVHYFTIIRKVQEKGTAFWACNPLSASSMPNLQTLHLSTCYVYTYAHIHYVHLLQLPTGRPPIFTTQTKTLIIPHFGFLVNTFPWKQGYKLRCVVVILRATRHTRLRARDHYNSSTLIDGKGGAGPSSLHTTLEGPTEYVNARWM